MRLPHAAPALLIRNLWVRPREAQARPRTFGPAVPADRLIADPDRPHPACDSPSLPTDRHDSGQELKLLWQRERRSQTSAVRCGVPPSEKSSICR